MFEIFSDIRDILYHIIGAVTFIHAKSHYES